MSSRVPTIVAFATMLLATGSCQPPETDAPSAPHPLIVGSVSVTLQELGSLSVAGSADGVAVIDVDLPHPESCDFVRWAGTNVIHLERYYDAWIALIQCHSKVDENETDPRFGCDTRYKALVVRDDGKVFLNPESNGGTGCPPIDRDRLQFTSLAEDYAQIEDQ